MNISNIMDMWVFPNKIEVPYDNIVLSTEIIVKKECV